jgi:hypothetical protein
MCALNTGYVVKMLRWNNIPVVNIIEEEEMSDAAISITSHSHLQLTQNGKISICVWNEDKTALTYLHEGITLDKAIEIIKPFYTTRPLETIKLNIGDTLPIKTGGGFYEICIMAGNLDKPYVYLKKVDKDGKPVEFESTNTNNSFFLCVK